MTYPGQCGLCGYRAEDRMDLGNHLANEHPAEWEMAVQTVALQLLGPEVFNAT